MEFERYEDVIDAFERDNMGYETLTDYINGNNIKIAEIDMEPMADLKKALGAKEGGLMVAIQKFNQGGPIRKNYLIGGNVSKNTPNTPYDSRASVADFARAIDRVGAGTDLQKSMDIDRYGKNVQRQNLESNINALKAAASVPYNFAKGIIGNFNNPQDLTQVSLTDAQKARIFAFPGATLGPRILVRGRSDRARQVGIRNFAKFANPDLAGPV